MFLYKILITIIIFSAVLLCSAVISGCGTFSVQETVVYQRADSYPKWDNSNCIVRDYPSVGISPIFLIENGRLFLRVQRNYPRLGLVMVVDHEVWNEKKIAELKAANSRFGEFLPDPKKRNGGIRWIEETEQNP